MIMAIGSWVRWNIKMSLISGVIGNQSYTNIGMLYDTRSTSTSNVYLLHKLNT